MITTSGNPSSDGTFSVRLPSELGSARVARRLLGDLLSEVRPSGRVVREAELVLHELVMNGVIHGHGDEMGEIEVSCSVVGGKLLISVQDHGTHGVVAVRPPTENDDSGRGLAMVAGLSTSWTVDRSAGTRVTACLTL